jgi:hypothetical protein
VTKIVCKENVAQQMTELLMQFVDIASMFPSEKPDAYVWERVLIFAPLQRTEPVSDDIASILACRDMLDAQPVPPQRTEPVDYEKLAALGWQAIECGICGGGAMGYPQRTEQNFCPRCGKRTKDLTTIHTCTPPQD